MPPRRFSIEMEHFGKARRALMAPFHRDDENEGFAGAMRECSQATRQLKTETVSDDARDLLAIVTKTLDYTGLVDPDGRDDMPLVKARQMTREQKEGFSRAVDALATHFWFQHFLPDR